MEQLRLPNGTLQLRHTSAAFSPPVLRQCLTSRLAAVPPPRSSHQHHHVSAAASGAPGAAMRMHAGATALSLSRVACAAAPLWASCMHHPGLAPPLPPAAAAASASRLVAAQAEAAIAAGGAGARSALLSAVQVGTQTTRPGSSDSGSGRSSSGQGGPSGGSPGDPGGDNQFALNFGEAVTVLCEDLPCLFERDPRLHIFRDDLVFRTPSMRYATGLLSYQVLHRAVRYLGNLLYADMSLSLQRMWQPAGNKQQLRVRWCVSGRPRLALSPDDDPMSTEVISTYTFDSTGKIYQHQVDQIIPPESMLVRLFDWLVGRLQPGMVLTQPGMPLPVGRDSSIRGS